MDIKTMPALDSVWTVEVTSVRRLDGCGNLCAFVDIRIGGALIVTQCAVMKGTRGLFATLPRQLSRDGRWRDVVVAADDDLRAHYQAAILAAYEADLNAA